MLHRTLLRGFPVLVAFVHTVLHLLSVPLLRISVTAKILDSISLVKFHICQSHKLRTRLMTSQLALDLNTTRERTALQSSGQMLWLIIQQQNNRFFKIGGQPPTQVQGAEHLPILSNNARVKEWGSFCTYTLIIAHEKRYYNGSYITRNDMKLLLFKRTLGLKQSI